MDDLVLFVETPRAGDFGHRFLVPPDADVREREVSAFFRVVGNGRGVGANYLAVARPVRQQTSTGAVRECQETIVVAGVDALRISPESLDCVMTLLQGCLDELGALVGDSGTWDRRGQTRILVPHPSLATWMHGLRNLKLPSTDWRNGPRPFDPAQPTGCKALSIGKLHVVALFLGIALCAGGIFVSGRFPAGTAEVQNGPVNGNPEPEPTLDGEPGTARSLDDNDILFVDLAPALREAIEGENIEGVVNVLSSLPSGARIPEQDIQALISFCDELVETLQVDDGLRIIQQIGLVLDVSTLGSDHQTHLNDLRRKAEEGGVAIDQEDRRLYEAIRQHVGTGQLEAARMYLRAAPRQTMAQSVRQWTDWAEGCIDIEIFGLDVPDSGMRTIRISIGDREIGFKNIMFRRGQLSPPLRFATADLGVTMRDLPKMLTFSVVREDGVPFHSNRLVGELRMTTQTTGVARVSVEQRPVPREPVNLDVSITSPGVAPELPEWRNSP